MRKGGFFVAGVLVGLAAMGCPNAPVADGQVDDDRDAVLIFVGDGFIAAVREGQSTGEQFVDICDGWFPAAANHELTIDTPLNMDVKVEGDVEARLWVLCEGSNYCGDVLDNRTEFNRFWNRADCEIYIGTADEGGEIEYELELEAE